MQKLKSSFSCLSKFDSREVRTDVLTGSLTSMKKNYKPKQNKKKKMIFRFRMGLDTPEAVSGDKASLALESVKKQSRHQAAS